MTPLNLETMQDKLFKLDKNIDFINDILKDSDEQILKDAPRYNGLEHILQISIQTILNISAHILAENFKENPGSYQEVITSLGKHDIVPADFASKQTEMAKFRNFLVHNYDLVDQKKVLEYAKTAPEIFKVFGKVFREFIKQ